MRRAVLVGFIALYLVLSPVMVHAESCLSAIDAPGCMHGLPAEEYQALLSVMLANPGPAVSPLSPAQEDIERYTVKNSSGIVTAKPSSFGGRVMGGALPFQSAWIMRPVQPSALPGGNPVKDAPVLNRYSLVYIFATVRAKSYAWYLVGPGQWIERRKVALVKPPTRPASVTGKWVAVDLAEQVLTAYEDDRPVFVTLISSGLSTHQTRKGLFHIKIHLLTDDMSGSMGQPDEYSLPYVPYVMYFDGDIALHGAYWHDAFGYPRSHGCVNMSLTDSRWMFQWTENTHTPVYVWRSR